MAHSFAHIPMHFVFSTKDRQPLIDTELRPELYAYIGGILNRIDCTPICSGGVSDHMHILTMLPRTIEVADVMREVKSCSSKWLRQEMGRPKFGWQSGYGAFAIGRSEMKRIERYIGRQEQHHKRESFQDEYRRFLRSYGIPFDERYMWE